MYGYKVYFNLFLYHVGIRHILPSAVINNCTIYECGESLVKYQHVYVRQTVAKMLDFVQNSLPHGYSLNVVCGHLSRAKQLQNWNKGIILLEKKYPKLPLKEIENKNRKMNADPRTGFGPHQTGGAIDLTLYYKNKPVDMGGDCLSSHNSRTYAKHLTQEQRYNRNILIKAMNNAGFQNYPNEWWHWSFGDRAWATYKHKKYAIYGKK